MEYKESPLGIDTPAPRFSWRLSGDRRGILQSSYQVQVGTAGADLLAGRNLVWESGRVLSDQSIQVVYGGPSLGAGQRYWWRVKVWDEANRPSAWSAVAWWEMGLLTPADWRARWIEPDLQEDIKSSNPSPMLRRAFRLSSRPRSARAYVTSHGLYELTLNGSRVGDQLFTPGWTSYGKRLQYQTYDVTSLVRAGDNAVGALLGDGWYRGHIGFSDQRNLYGERLGLLAQIVVTYGNGTSEVIGTDAQWTASTGPIRMSEIYHGEIYDARLEKRGWDQPGYDDANWTQVRVVDHPRDILVAPSGPPVKRIEEIKPKRIFTTPGGDTVADFGQNMVGWVRLRVQGPAGTTVTLRHVEVLDKDGNVYVENLRAAKQTTAYTLKGGGVEEYEPRFTFQGFQFVDVDGYPGEMTPDSLTGIVIHSEMAPTGSLTTSNALVNQLQRNILWGQKGNFLDVPTDCPQRDERLGWTGDAQAFARTAAYNMDVAAFFTRWLGDIAADQLASGSVPFVVPDVLSTRDRPAAGSAGWADAAVIIPWTLFQAYGDRRILEVQYPSMRKWVDYMHQRAGDDLIWTGDFHFGDWLAFATTRSDYPGATTGKDLIATAFFAHSTDLLARAARVIGRADEAVRYETLLSDIKTAWVREFVSSTGRVGENTQTAYVLALQFDLLPDALRDAAAARLAAEVRERKHLTTGFLGTPYLCHVLSRYGYLAEAYQLLEREEYPSWLYPVTKGATTIWERWDGLKPDGSFQDKGMNSFNHYAYGAVGDWMYRVMAGLEIDETRPGYKHTLVQPRPGGAFTRVEATHDTPYGRLGSAWSIVEGRFELAVEVPPNTTATIRLPGAARAAVTESGRGLAGRDGIAEVTSKGDASIVKVGSGKYVFTYVRVP